MTISLNSEGLCDIKIPSQIFHTAFDHLDEECVTLAAEYNVVCLGGYRWTALPWITPLTLEHNHPVWESASIEESV